MARVISLMAGQQDVRVAPSDVDCYYQVIVGSAGETLLHLSTFGSKTRQSRPKSSQSIQIDAAIARELVGLLKRTFPEVDDPRLD
jgi:hypothetical protein